MIDVFTDASLIKKNNTFSIGYAIHFPNKEFENIVDSIDVHPSNADIHYAEMYGIYTAIIITKSKCSDHINIYTDSMHSVNAIYKWINIYYEHGLDKLITNKKNPIKNRDILVKIFDQINGVQNNYTFTHVKAHTRSAEYKFVNNKSVDIMVRKHIRNSFKNK